MTSKFDRVASCPILCWFLHARHGHQFRLDRGALLTAIPLKLRARHFFKVQGLPTRALVAVNVAVGSLATTALQHELGPGLWGARPLIANYALVLGLPK